MVGNGATHVRLTCGHAADIYADETSNSAQMEIVMARYIIIDNESGFIFADTADLPGFDGSAPAGDDAIIQAVRCLNASIGYDPDGFTYEVNDSFGGDNHYTIYRADINGSEAVAVIHDGQNQEMIEAVERDCERVGSVKVTNLEA